MGRALILVESLAAALLLVALAAAWASRRPAGPGRWGIPLFVLLLVTAPATLTLYGLNYLRVLGTVSTTSVVAVAVWTTAFVVGSFAVISSGLRAGAGPEARPWSLGSLAVALAVAVVLTLITTSNLDVAVKGQLAALRVEAGAKALALVPPRLSESQNAAPIYRKAFAALTPADQLPALLRDRASAWTAYDRAAFDPADKEQREFLESQQRGLALLREAAAVPQCAFERDWSDEVAPLDLPLPELPQLRHASTLLAYDALARAHRGDARGAIDDVVAIFGMARHLPYPLLIDVYMATAIEKKGAKALEDVLALTTPRAEDLARVIVGGGDSFRQRLRQTFAMEEAWGIAAFVMISTGRARASADIQATTPMDAFGESLLDSPVYRVFFLEEDLATYRRHMRTMRENAARPAPAMIDGFEEHDRSLRSNRGGGILAGLLIPAAYKVAYAALDGDATRGLVRLALAAATYKAKHGKYPAKAADLVPEFIPEVPADPYDGRPLRMKADGEGVVFYSIGRDRKDDGGKPWDDSSKQEGDLVFRLR